MKWIVQVRDADCPTISVLIILYIVFSHVGNKTLDAVVKSHLKHPLTITIFIIYATCLLETVYCLTKRVLLKMNHSSKQKH